MSQRLNYTQFAPELLARYLEFHNAVAASSLPATLRHLITIRASQLNGCAFCLDMHVKEARMDGERELRVHHVAIWRESMLFDARERAALAWCEALTRLDSEGVSDEVHEHASAHFSPRELVELTFLIMEINGWNRASIAFRTTPGSLDKAYGLDKAGLS